MSRRGDDEATALLDNAGRPVWWLLWGYIVTAGATLVGMLA